MRLRHIKGAEDFVANSEYVEKNPQDYKGLWALKRFGNNFPLHVEIGMGKGQFLLAMAEKYPHINFIGVERYDTVLLKAIRKRKRMEAVGKEYSNLIYIDVDARLLSDVFSKDEVSCIYLNFSDPWPKERQANRRLTSPVYLNIYHGFLRNDGELKFKTDNSALFHWSLDVIPVSGWKILRYSNDLHKDPLLSDNNVMTEYEEKFSSKGAPIHFLTARP